METMYAALREAFKILPGDRHVRCMRVLPVHRIGSGPKNTHLSASTPLRGEPWMPREGSIEPLSQTWKRRAFRLIT